MNGPYPQQPYHQQQPYQQPYPFQQPNFHQPPKKKRTGLIITAVVAVAVLVGGGVTAAVLVSGDEKKPARQDATPADGDVVDQVIAPEGVTYGGVAVLDACALMPVTLLEETGFGDVAHGLHSQTYVPKSVPTAAVKDASDGITSCRYDVVKPGRIDFLVLTVDQAPFNDVLPAEVIGNDRALTVGGLRAFANQEGKPGSFSTRIYSADGQVEARLLASRLNDNKELDYEAAHAELLEKVAQNLAKAPEEQARFAFAGRYRDVPNACDVLTGELFEQVAQVKDSGVVQAEITEGEGRNDVHQGGDTKYTYQTHQMCQRSSPEWHMREKGSSLKMQLTTHRDAEMARINEPDCDPDSPSRKVLGGATNAQEKVGDADACAFPIGDSLVFSFTVGRTQVRLTPYGSWAPKDVQAFIEKFTPIAKTVADEVRKAIG